MSVPPEQPAAASVPPSRVERTRLRAAALQGRADRIAERAQAGRADHGSLDTTFEVIERDAEVAGGIIAGALAYRFFIWMLPLALVLVVGLGVAADAASRSPAAAAKSLGLAGLVSNSVASAANSSSRWYALLVGIPVLFLATKSLLRVLIGAHRLVWVDLRDAAPRPTPRATVRLLILVCCFFIVSGAASAARAGSLASGIAISLILIIPYAALWLLIAIRLPHRDAHWRALIPGALLFGVGVELIHLVAAYAIAPMSLSKQGTYGVLGIAAALLLGLFLTSRIIVAAAVLNATLWDRRSRVAVPTAPSSRSFAS
jgi:hypothetical protein